MKGLVVLILAAGKGRRFQSEKPKVLQPILGKPILRIVLDSVFGLKPEKVYVVIGRQVEKKAEDFSDDTRIRFIRQSEPLGTAHAVFSARKALAADRNKDVLILYGDNPLLTTRTLRTLLTRHRRRQNSLTFLTGMLDDPAGYGRIARGADGSLRVIEEQEAATVELKVKEVNVGAFVFRAVDLLRLLPAAMKKTQKKERYLTTLVEACCRRGSGVEAFSVLSDDEIFGVNTRFDLVEVAHRLRARKIRELAAKGVTFYDPATTWIDLEVEVGPETVIHSSVIIEGKSRIGAGCRIYPFVHLSDTRLGDRVKVLSSTVIRESVVEDDVQVGPFTHLRPKTTLRKGAKVGNFVEMKNTVFGRNSKAGHLSYLGDAEVEEEVNIGAGTITCNFDGVKKSRTHIEAGAFIGSGVELVAPVRVGRGAYIGAGSTITKNVAPQALAVARSRQIEKPGWAKRRKKKQE